MKPEEKENAQWDYKKDDTSSEATSFDSSTDDSQASKTIHQTAPSISWSAPEFIQHERSPLWYPALLVAFVGLAAIMYIITKDKIAAGVVVVVGIIVAFAAARKPRDVSCQITGGTISVGTKTYGFSQFKSFGIIREGKLSYVELIPVKRFMPAVSAYFKDVDEHQITSAIGQYLPYEERKMAGVERLSHHFKF
jgi:hypothetical protein